MPYKDQHSSAAKESFARRHAKWYARNIEEIRRRKRIASYRDRELRAEWEKKNKNRRASIIKKYVAKNRDAIAARSAVCYALKIGKLTRPAHCETCGVIEKVQAHHRNGYEGSHKLDVSWLCVMCHKKEHRAA